MDGLDFRQILDRSPSYSGVNQTEVVVYLHHKSLNRGIGVHLCNVYDSS